MTFKAAVMPVFGKVQYIWRTKLITKKGCHTLSTILTYLFG